MGASMQRSDRRWKFSIAVLLPVGAARAASRSRSPAGFILWSAQRTDDAALARQQSRRRPFRARRQVRLRGRRRARSSSATKPPKPSSATSPTSKWIDAEMGWAEYDDFGHDRVYVLDAEPRSRSTPRAGARARTSPSTTPTAAIIDPMAVRFRSPELAAAIAAYENGDADWPPQLSDFVDLRRPRRLRRRPAHRLELGGAGAGAGGATISTSPSSSSTTASPTV